MRTLILGAGVSGTAAARLARQLGHQVTVYDADPKAGADLIASGVGLISGRWEPELLNGIELVVASPGFPLRSAPITDSFEAGLRVWSELEFAWRQLTAPVVAVTGTNGKTTVTEAIAAILAESGLATVAAGNIGTALSDVVGEAFDVVVVEASSFQLELTESLHPSTGVFLNLAPDHLDWHPSLAAYTAAKEKIFRWQSPSDMLIYDADDPGLQPVLERLQRRSDPPTLLPVSGRRRPPGGFGPEGDLLHLPGLDLPLATLAGSDPIDLVNFTAAATAAHRHGATAAAIAAVGARFRPGPHRRTPVGSWRGISFVDDSKATNPHAALAAIAAYPSVVLIAGGLSKGLDVTPLARAARIRHLVALGEAAEELVAASLPERATRVSSMEEAVEVAVAVARPGDTVLLAPGCASFDLYQSYRARGEAFINAVNHLIAGGAA